MASSCGLRNKPDRRRSASEVENIEWAGLSVTILYQWRFLGTAKY
jgi:hypothetical protein